MAAPMSAPAQREPSSFRDNRGYVFWRGSRAYRQINLAGKEGYDGLMRSGLYQLLLENDLIIKHRELSETETPPSAYRLIKPELIPFISYPYEWSFSQLKDAALATLRIQQLALEREMSLRDASAYNIQYIDGLPRLIDTLSFDKYHAGEPWVAYRQFCQHFLAPLALMSYRDPALLQLLRVYIDGIPLQLAAELLPRRARLRPALITHLNFHARMQTKHQGSGTKPQTKMSRTALLGLIDSLHRAVKSLELPKVSTEWGNYYNATNYSTKSFAQKGVIVSKLAVQAKPKRVVDLGANNGHFSRIIAKATGALVISADIDPLAVEQNYREVRDGQQTHILPILLDLTNPSPDLGWSNQERTNFTERAKSDLLVALALIHHLAISNNVPLDMICDYCATLAPALIMEFVPKADSQVKKLLSSREDIFPDYSSEGFELAFSKKFHTIAKKPVPGTSRSLYFMQRK